MGTKNATEIIGTATLTVLAIMAAAFVVACGGGDDTSTGQLEGIADSPRGAMVPAGFDPAPAATAQSTDVAQRADYVRAQSACLGGRGYTVG